MRIGINLLSLVTGKIGGMEQYIRNLIWYSVHSCEDYELFLFLSDSNANTFEEETRITKIIISPQNEIEKNLVLSKKIIECEIDIWFCPLLVLEPKYLSIPTVITIPDIQHEFYPDFFSQEVLEWRKQNFGFSAQKANAVLTLSQFSKDTIVNTYKVPSEKVFSIYLDSTKEFYLPPNQEYIKSVKEKYDLPDDFVFYPANTWPHKNHINLIRAIHILRDKYKKQINVILTGSEDQAHATIRDYINQHDLSDQIKFLGYIDQNEMPYIYMNASLLVFPSLFEGFGIPLVEAMRTETPILCSNAGSIPEVVEKCALMFDPTDPEEIAQSILKMENNAMKRDLVNKGLEQAKKFSWDNSSQETLQVFESVIKQHITSKDHLPLVSIITPSYNQGKFIKETIESVLNQDYPNIEYIVMDGGSNDETVEILRSYGNKIKWVSEKDGGQADAVNKGIKVANGEIIGWLNSDDTYLPDAIKDAVAFLQLHNELGMVYGEGYHTTEQGDIIDRYPTESFNYSRLAETCFICQPTGFIRKSVFDEIGLLDKDLHLCMDYELWMRIGKKFEIGYIPHFLATSRMYEDNKTLSRRKEVFKEIMSTVKKNYHYVPISWVYGYVDYLLGSKRNSKFYLYLLFFIFKYNLNNLPHFFASAKQIVKSKLKQKMNSQPFYGRYEDGWVSKEYVTNFTSVEGTRNLKIIGRHLWPYNETLKISVCVNNQKKKTFRISDKGTFSFEIDISEITKEASLKLTANKTFNPKKLRINEDTRDLAYIIDQIEL